MNEDTKHSDDNMNFFQRLIASIFGAHDDEAEKKRLLRQIAKNLSKTHSKFYKYGSDEVLVPYAKLFYDIYKTVAAAQAMFQSIENPNVLKMLVINTVLTDRQIELVDLLSETSITERAQKLSVAELDAEIKKLLEQFDASFENDTIAKADVLYSCVVAMQNFCKYDYFFMLRKFCSGLKERNFDAAPVFSPISGEYIIDDLKDFITVAWPVVMIEADWKAVMALFKAAKGFEPVPLSAWNKLISRLKTLRNAQVFEMMIKLTSKNPFYEASIKVPNEHIFDTYLERIKAEASQTVKKLVQQQKNSRITSLVQQLFGSESVSCLKGYSESVSALFQRKSFDGYTFSQPLNYMKQFLIDYVKRDIRLFTDLVLVRGKWTTISLATPMSDAYNALISLSDTITQFDNGLSDESPAGSKLKMLAARADRDKESHNIIKTQLRDINNQARLYLVNGTQNLVIFGKQTRSLLNDYTSNSGSLIINWKELERFAETPIQEQCEDIYKHIYVFVSLMQNYIGK